MIFFLPRCTVCCVILFQPRLFHISLAALFVVLSSFSPASFISPSLHCLLCCPLSAPPLSYLPRCTVCCVVLFQPRLFHISLAALFVVLSSFSPASFISPSLHCLLCCPLSAPPLSYLPRCTVCCVVLFQPRLFHISLAALFVVLSSFSPASFISPSLHCLLCCPLSAPPLSYLPRCTLCCVVLFQPRLFHISLAALFVVLSSFSPASFISHQTMYCKIFTT